MQWGTVPVDDTKNVIYDEWNKYTIRFPIEFPNKILSLNVSLEMQGAEPTGNVAPYIYECNVAGAWGIVDLGYYTKDISYWILISGGVEKQRRIFLISSFAN